MIRLRQSHLVVSLDFERMWGVRDQLSIAQYGANIFGVRDALPRILELFEKFDIRATWATVGFLFCETRDELIASLPALRPAYRQDAFSNYSYLGEVGNNEKDEPYYFGFSLLKAVRNCPRLLAVRAQARGSRITAWPASLARSLRSSRNRYRAPRCFEIASGKSDGAQPCHS